MSDKKYLFKRNNTWWVKLAVPLSLRNELGYDLRRTTGEQDLDKAIPIRDKIIEEFESARKNRNQTLGENNSKELEKRRKIWSKPKPKYKKGVLAKYSRIVSSSSLGAVTDLED